MGWLLSDACYDADCDAITPFQLIVVNEGQFRPAEPISDLHRKASGFGGPVVLATYEDR